MAGFQVYINGRFWVSTEDCVSITRSIPRNVRQGRASQTVRSNSELDAQEFTRRLELLGDAIR